MVRLAQITAIAIVRIVMDYHYNSIAVICMVGWNKMEAIAIVRIVLDYHYNSIAVICMVGWNKMEAW